MLDAGIPDIALERDKTVMKVARNALFNEFKKLLILNVSDIGTFPFAIVRRGSLQIDCASYRIKSFRQDAIAC